MIVEILNPNFSDICGFRFARGSTVIDTVMKVETSAIGNPNFIETDFKYDQGKLEIKSPNILDEVDRNDQLSLINADGYESIQKFFLTLFPTYKESSASNQQTSYFSTSTNVDGDELYCLDIKNTEVNRLYGIDNSGASVLKIDFESSELGYSKVVVLIISFKSETPRIVNLSLTSYLGDNTPYRKMPSYVLRNDGLVENWRGLTEKYGFLYSDISGSLVGIERIPNNRRPIYNLLKDFSEKETSWNRAKRYTIGDYVKVGNCTYESVEPNNIGNNPVYSRMWVKNDN